MIVWPQSHGTGQNIVLLQGEVATKLNIGNRIGTT